MAHRFSIQRNKLLKRHAFYKALFSVSVSQNIVVIKGASSEPMDIAMICKNDTLPKLLEQSSRSKLLVSFRET